jgi:hypothetical protein
MILANVVWPALYILSRYYTWWAIGIGLLIECVVLRLLTKDSAKKVVLAVAVANLITAIIGYFTIPWITLGWDFALEYTVYQLLDVGTFNPFGWITSILLISAITAFPELLIIQKLFKIELRTRAWTYWWAANALSVLLAFLTVLIWPVQT